GRQKGLERYRGREFARPYEAAGEFEDALVNRLEKVPVLKEVRDAIKRLVIDQNCPQQRLLGLDIMRRRAEVWFRKHLFACNRIDWCHGPDQEIRVWLFLEHSTSRTTQRQRHSSPCPPQQPRATSIIDMSGNRKCSLRLSPLLTPARRKRHPALDAKPTRQQGAAAGGTPPRPGAAGLLRGRYSRASAAQRLCVSPSESGTRSCRRRGTPFRSRRDRTPTSAGTAGRKGAPPRRGGRGSVRATP